MSIHIKQFYFTQYFIEIIDLIEEVKGHIDKAEMDSKDIAKLQNVHSWLLRDIGQHIVEQWHFE